MQQATAGKKYLMDKSLVCLFSLWMDAFLVLPTFIPHLYITVGFIPEAILLNQNLSHIGNRKIDCFWLFNLLIMNLLVWFSLSPSPCAIPALGSTWLLHQRSSQFSVLAQLAVRASFQGTVSFDSSRQALLEDSQFLKCISLTCFLGFSTLQGLTVW